METSVILIARNINSSSAMTSWLAFISSIFWFMPVNTATNKTQMPWSVLEDCTLWRWLHWIIAQHDKQDLSEQPMLTDMCVCVYCIEPSRQAGDRCWQMLDALMINFDQTTNQSQIKTVLLFQLNVWNFFYDRHTDIFLILFKEICVYFICY